MNEYAVFGENYKPKAIKTMSYQAPTDDELYAASGIEAQQAYKDNFDRLFNQAKGKKDVMMQSIRNAQANYQTAVSELGREYDQSSKTLSQQALMRGLGRSSYALDIQKENQGERHLGLQQLLTGKMQTVNHIQNQIDALEKEFIDNQTYLTQKKASDVRALLTKLKSNRDETMRDVLAYNNDLLMDQKEFNLKQLKADRDYALDLAKNNRSTRSTSSTKSKSTSSASIGKPKTLMEEYTTLTYAGKLKFFNQNEDLMRNTLDLDTYKNVLRGIYEIVKQGIQPATSKKQGYYK